jgi:putative membrane protein
VDAPAEAPVLGHRLIALVHALRHQLRRTDAMPDLARLLSTQEMERVRAARFRPALLLLMASEWLRDMRVRGAVSPPLVQAMEGSLGLVGAAVGGCERIANTPIPFTYSVIIHRTIYIYCILLPFGLVDAIGPMTPVIVAFIAYTFFALEALGSELEEPFGMESNDLALDTLCWTIEASVRETLGEANDTPEPQARGYVLT